MFKSCTGVCGPVCVYTCIVDCNVCFVNIAVLGVVRIPIRKENDNFEHVRPGLSTKNGVVIILCYRLPQHTVGSAPRSRMSRDWYGRSLLATFVFPGHNLRVFDNRVLTRLRVFGPKKD
jgi:hypothetical protein